MAWVWLIMRGGGMAWIWRARSWGAVCTAATQRSHGGAAWRTLRAPRCSSGVTSSARAE